MASSKPTPAFWSLRNLTGHPLRRRVLLSEVLGPPRAFDPIQPRARPAAPQPRPRGEE